MELFKSGLKTVLGTQSASNGSSDGGRGDEGAETVEKLVERLQTSTLLDDRRGACRALRSLSKKYRVEVGAQGMDALVNVLSVDRTDQEIVAYALESLLNVTSPDSLEDEDPNLQTMGKQFTEIFIKKSENVVMLLSILDDYDFRIRLPAIRLMTNLLVNKPKEIQEILLVIPMGTAKLVDLLSDSREVVRNEALLLLAALTKSNANIQKIIAFENGFDRIIHIIESEGFSDGGPIVEDSLHLFLNLLKNNTSNQTFFREGSYIKKLLPFFSQPDENDIGWPTQKVANVYHMLQVARTLVSPLNPSQVTLSCQKSMKSCGILQSLCSILMANGVPAETLTEAIVTVGECIRGCPENQEYFATVMAPSDPPRPALLILLMTLVNERQPLNLRCAVLYCVQSYLHKNEKSQAEIVKTLLPSSTEGFHNYLSVILSTLSAGQLLCSGLFSKDPTSNWFAAGIISHCLLDNAVQKESLLKVQLATKANSPPITLLHHIFNTVQQTTKTQVKIGFLQFLSVWLDSCSKSVTQFLSYPNAIPFLISQITSGELEDKEVFVQGLSAFVLGLCLYFNPDTVPSFTKCEETLKQWDDRIYGIALELCRLDGKELPALLEKTTGHNTVASSVTEQGSPLSEKGKGDFPIHELLPNLNLKEPISVPEELTARHHCDFIQCLSNAGCPHLAEKILLLLDSSSLSVASGVCTGWADLIKSANIWKKKLLIKVPKERKWAALVDKIPDVKELLINDDFNDFSLLYLSMKTDLDSSEHTWHRRGFNFLVKKAKLSSLGGIYCVQFDANKIILGTRSNVIIVLDRSFRKLKKFEGHTGSVLCLQYDDTIIVSGSSDSTVRVWDIETGSILNTLRNQCGSITDLKFGFGYLVTSSNDGTLVVWNFKSSNNIELKYKLLQDVGAGAVNATDFDQEYIVSGFADGFIRVWETVTGAYLKILTGHNGSVSSLQYRSNYIVSGSSDMTVRIWKLDEGACIRILAGHHNLVRSVRFDERFIISGCYNGRLIIWDFKAAIESCEATPALNDCFIHTESLTQLITNRIGMETLTDGLNHISKSEFYLHSLKHPQVNAKHSTDLLFDHSFCLLFKKYEPQILLQLSNPHSQVLSPRSTLASEFSKMGYINNHQSPNDVINSYKEVIRRQDENIDSCKKEITMLQVHNSEYKSKVEEMLSEVMQLKNQLALAQAQRESMTVRQIPEDHHLAVVAAKDNLIKELEAKLEGHNQSYTGGSPVLKIAMQEELITKLEDENKQLVEEVERMKKDQEELLELLTEQDNRISSFKSRLREMGAHVEEEEDAEDELVPANMAAFDGGEDFLN